MRRAVQAFIIGSVLCSAAACGTATPAPGEPGAGIGSATPPPAAEQSAAASTRSACEALGLVYSRYMAPFAQSLTELVDGREKAGDAEKYRKEVQEALTAFATGIRTATKESTDPELRNDGERTAARLTAEDTREDLFKEVRTRKDVDTTLGPTLKEWLSPVDAHCS